MSNNIAVNIKNVSKSFRLPIEATNSLRSTLVNYFKGIKGYREQHVLKDISFEIEKGDFFGIVGRNGSGKSTLLKIISQIYTPEKGSITIDGRLVSFIELGVGFNPELTGRENVYLNGALLGFSTKEIDEMYDEIVDFAELHEFMNQKLKNYSSGMQVRLAFSVAIKAKSDILVLDEVLAVGDEAFQRKCNDYFLQVKKEGKTVILVTHSMDAVRKYCNKAVLIDSGLVSVYGTPDEVANQYSLDNIENTSNHKHDSATEENSKKLIKDFKVDLLSNNLLEDDNRMLVFEISYEVTEPISTYIAFSLTDIDRNVWMYNDNSYDYKTHGVGKHTIRYSCELNDINKAKLQLGISVRNDNDEPIFFADSNNKPVVIVAPKAEMKKSELISSSGILTRNGCWSHE